MTRLSIGVAVAVAVLLGAATSTATAASRSESRAVLRAAKRAERDWLAHRTRASCSHYTGAAKRRLVVEVGVSVTCEGTLKVVFDLMGPDDDAQIRRTLRTLSIEDVSVRGRRARIALSGHRTLKLRRIAGRWYISDPSTTN